MPATDRRGPAVPAQPRWCSLVIAVVVVTLTLVVLDMCAPPSDGTGPLLHDPPFNTNGSVCINFTCRLVIFGVVAVLCSLASLATGADAGRHSHHYRTATVTEGQPCEVEQIPYIAYSDTDEFAFVVSR